MTSDADLVRATLAGRREAYEEIVRRYSARLYAICWSRLGRRDLAADLVQETLLRGYRSLSTLEEPERIGGWLCGIAVHACLDFRKDREQAQVSYDALGPDSDVRDFLGAPADDPTAAQERRAQVLAEVQALPEIYREAVTLFYFERLTYAQMQPILGIGPQAINARLSKARVLLRDRLKNGVG